MTIKEGDFVEVDFVGRIKSTNDIFDLTSKEEAEKAGIKTKTKLEPLIIKIGARQVIQAMDEQLIGKKEKDEFEFDVEPEKGFGKRNPKLIQLTSLAVFRARNMNPVPGMQLNLDGALATVRSVSGGRVILDFNHPLAGKTLHYKVKVLRIVKDAKEKLESIGKFYNIPFKAEVKEKTAAITLEKKDIQKEIKEQVQKKLEQMVPEIKVSFV